MTRFTSFLQVALLLNGFSTIVAFTVNRRFCAPSRHQIRLYQSEESSSDSGSTRKGKRRVRRKQPVDSSEPEKVAETPDLKPRKESAVSMEVTDIRDLVSGGSSGSGRNSPASSEDLRTPKASVSAAAQQASTSEANSAAASTSLDDSLEQLLADAKKMKALEKTDENEVDSSEGGAMASVRNVISTIVTVDFFVVCAFLLWFLAGIFCSYILKDDTVQIAFNSNFQALVQPALGVLMIAAIADAVTKEKDDEA